ncbi:MAG: hypothetical protein K8J31_10395 [Anaerolineae bacterium]|nr:hypothetical protein [Anaerolineae bacterium]
MPVLILLILLLILLALGVWSNDRQLNAMTNREIDALFASRKPAPDWTFTQAEIAHLPEPVQTYLKRNVPEGQPAIYSVRLKQSGQMRLSPDQPWKPFRAEQYFTVDPCAFLWRVKSQFLPLIWVSGRDQYARQQGDMLIKILSTLTVARASGPKTSVSALIRDLAEMIWFPTAWVHNDRLRWEAVDATTARAILHDHGVEARVTFHFDADGDLRELESNSRYQNETDAQPTRWWVTFGGYETFHGVRIPAQAEVSWEPESGRYAWWRGTITTIDYNIPARYGNRI